MHAPSEAEAAALVIIFGVEAIVPWGADLFMNPHRVLTDDATARLAGRTTRGRVVTCEAVGDCRIAELTIRHRKARSAARRETPAPAVKGALERC